jgi:hypothetical protein
MPRLAALALALLVLAGCGDDEAAGPAVAAPIRATGGEPATVLIPEGFLRTEALMRKPLNQPGVRWVRTDGPHLPPLASPCGGPLPSDRDRVGGRQVALLGVRGWKLERLIVYRDAQAARRALAERRAAMRRCRRHGEGGGIVTEWISRPLDIGDDAMFIGGQRFRGSAGVPGNYRGIVMREGRVVVMYVDFGPRKAHARLQDVALYVRHARTMARKATSL